MEDGDSGCGSGEITLSLHVERKNPAVVSYTAEEKMLTIGILVGFGILLTIVVVVVVIVILRKRRKTSKDIRPVEMQERPAEINHDANDTNIANFNNESEDTDNTNSCNEYTGRPRPVRKEPTGGIIEEQCKRDPGTRERVENEHLNGRECAAAERRGKSGSRGGGGEIRERKENEEDETNCTYEPLKARKQDDTYYMQLNNVNRIS